MEDPQFIERLKTGDEAAFSQLVRTYHHGMLHTAWAIAGESNAEEILQEAWIRIYGGLPKFEGRSSLKTWLYTIVANQAKGFLRNKKSRSPNSENAPLPQENVEGGAFDEQGGWKSPPTPWHEETPEALLSNQQLQDCLETALEQLPGNQKSACLLFDLEGVDMQGICNILEISESNFRVLLHRGRKRLLDVAAHYQKEGKCLAAKT